MSKKITELTALTGANLADSDVFPVVDVSDTTQAATGSTKKMTATELQKGLSVTGWANYVDNTYTSGSPLALSAATTAELANDGAGTLTNESQMPSDLVAMYAPKTLDYDAASADFNVGETVTGGTSSATGVIVKIESSGTAGTLFLKTVSGTFQNDEALTSAGGSAMVDGTLGAGRILGNGGDFYLLTLDFKAKPTNAATTYLEVWLDIGGAVGELYRRIITFPKGSGVERPCVITTGVYSLDTWESNGALVKVETPNTCDIYDIRFIIERVHKAV